MTDPNADPNVPNVPPPPPAQTAPSYGTNAPSYDTSSPSYAAAPAGQKTNVLAIVSLVSAFFISLVAIITGHIALSQIKKTGEQGRGLAIAGLIIGYVGLVVGIIVAIVWFAIIGTAISTGNVTTY
ncbi:hypothetical protein BCL57_002789 [Agromyces flavus]|uniref:DUF4190 domain-containing protein n=1 Tax=Agromyces flavus TaxID=589382 RepID=A0A1H1LSK5_9MICO|nr:DUF4190 domain-containing protein [Agromyces flavus]MCP2368613.1 hypothetical protein [Agromyces flavus]GGI48147.1 hypothetical protein GCM10010932_28350 [Agromyces flavus]SDR77322.1 protein of unknown function [Agromyces flavus]